MAAHTCAALLLLLAVAATCGEKPASQRWSRPLQGPEARSEWIPVSPSFTDSDVAAQEGVPTILRPPEPGNIRQQRLIQSPRQGRESQNPFFSDQSQFVRFPGEQSPQLRAPNGPLPLHLQQQQTFLRQPPVFLPPQPVPAGFPPQALTQPIPFQPQPIPVFNKPVTSPVKQNHSFVNAGPDEEVQLVYVPVEALQGQNAGSNRQPQFAAPSGSFEDKLKNFVKQQGPQPFITPQQAFDHDEQRIKRIREQEERKRIQDKEIREREEARQRKEQEEKTRREQEQRVRKEQELRDRQEQESRFRLEQERREQEEKQRLEAFRLQQQRLNSRPVPSEFVAPPPLASPSLTAQENAFQKHLLHTQPQVQTTTPAPHQPPLAVYMGAAPGKIRANIDDVLFALRDAVTIPVLDRLPHGTIQPPQVFVGPAEMDPPKGYSKFELPYLSSLENNRVERKVDQLPFFVAPLSFQPPNGYSKIPFPAPHVGSVVVSQGARHIRPVQQIIANDQQEYTPDAPALSPAIPLLVNSLQSARGRPNTQPHFVNQEPFSSQQFSQGSFPRQEQFPPFPRQQQFDQPQQNQFVHQQQLIPQQSLPPQNHFAQEQQTAPEIPQTFEQETIAPVELTEPPPTTTEFSVSRRPLNRVRQRPSQVEDESTTIRPRVPTRGSINQEFSHERRPVSRGRRPGARQRTTTTTEQPNVVEETNFDSSRENIPDQHHLVSSVAPPTYTASSLSDLSGINADVPSSQSISGEFPTHEQGFHALPVVPADASPRPDFDIPKATAHNNVPFRGHFITSPSPTHFQNFNPTPSAQTEFDFSNFEAPKKVNHVHNKDDTLRTRSRIPEAPPLSSTVEPTFDRPKPTILQDFVSSTPEPELQRHPSPTPLRHKPVNSFLSESPVPTPHHVVKGEVGKVQHPVQFPFIPTPLPDFPVEQPILHQESPAPELQVNTEAVTPTAQPIDELAPTSAPVNFESSQPRVKPLQYDTILSTARPRVRTQANTYSSEITTPSYQTNQRFRGNRIHAGRDESIEDIPTIAPQRVRTRVHTGRTRPASERPLNVADPDKNHSGESSSETTPRTRSRFRGGDVTRGRATAARQQIPRGRQTARPQDELQKPVKQHVGTENPASESPVYVPEVKFESGFVPAVDAQKSLPTSTEGASSTEASTPKPGRGRFNNFSTVSRVVQRRPHSRSNAATLETTTAAPVTNSGRNVGVRRRQQQQIAREQAGTRVAGARGRLRRPTTEAPEAEEENYPAPSTGVTYVKNPYVHIQRPGLETDPSESTNDVPEGNAEKAAPVARVRQERPQHEEENYPVLPTRYTSDPQSLSGTPRTIQADFFTVSTPTPLSRSSTTQSENQDDEQQFRTRPAQRQQRKRIRIPQTRYVTLDNPDDPEYGEESQRSEQISIQQLEGAIMASLYGKNFAPKDVQEELDGIHDALVGNNQEYRSHDDTDEALTEDELSDDTEASTEAETTEVPMTTISDEQVEQHTTLDAEPEQASDKPTLHAKQPSEGKQQGRRRRVRVQLKRRPGDLFETAESQNVAAVANSFSQELKKQGKKAEWSLALPNNPTIDAADETHDLDNSEEDFVHITTNAPEISTDENQIFETTSTSTTTTTPATTPEVTTPVPTTAQQSEVTTVPPTVQTTTEEEFTVTTEVTTTESSDFTTDTESPATPRILGTSTTTEISLETEICYRGRCVKTKVDADQMPILK